MEGLHGLPMYGVGGAAVLALAFAAYKSAWVGKQDSGTEKMTKIGGHIADGAMAFLSASTRYWPSSWRWLLDCLPGATREWLTAMP